MARSIFLPWTMLLSLLLLTFKSVLSIPAPLGVGLESTPSLSQDKLSTRSFALSPSGRLTADQNTTGWTWFYVSGDGSQILPIKGPQDKPAANLLTAGASNGGHSYTFGFSNDHGTATPRPGLAKFLFDCEFGLFDATPASGLGVWKPWPRGKYTCNGNLPGQLVMTLISNTINYKMAIHDLAFFIKVLHDTRGVEDSAPFFNFVFNYTPEVDTIPYETVVEGQWKNKYPDVAATS